MKKLYQTTQINPENQTICKNIKDYLDASKKYLKENKLYDALFSIYRARTIIKNINPDILNNDKALIRISNQVSIFYVTCITGAICAQAQKFIKN